MKKRISLLALSLLQLFGIAIGATLCWLKGGSGLDISNLKGDLYTGYFYSGSGTEEDPYTITRPIHYFNMVELIKYDSAYASKYYQLGYDFEEDGNLQVFDYDDDGTYSGHSDTLNMSYLGGVMPIGDEAHPFSGSFDGSNLTISNLTVFGEGLCDNGVFGFVTEDAVIKDTYFEDLNIDVTDMVADDASQEDHKDHEDTAYVGYLAGHIETATSFSNVFLNNVQILGSTNLASLKNDWGYYGYVEDAKSLDEFVAKAKGESIGWGGSVDMQKMYDRLYNMANARAATYTYEQTITHMADGTDQVQDTTNSNFREYDSEKAGHVVFSTSRGEYLYLHGGTTTYEKEQYQTGTRTIIESGYIKSGNTYLGTDGTNLNTTKTLWYFSAQGTSSTTVYSDVGGTRHYLHVTRSGSFLNRSYRLDLSTTSTTWDNSNVNRLQDNNYSRYVVYNNGWTVQSGSANLTLEGETTHDEPIYSVRDLRTYVDYTGTNNTYFPLITETDSYNADAKNTGYVISGSDDRTTSGTYPNKSGDIRVSEYGTSDISNSYRNGTLNHVYTIDETNRTVEIGSTNSFEKYNESKTGLLDSFDNGSIYGLHFMSAQISAQSIVTAPYALINGREYSNYQLPANSIDFNVTDRGLINFFGGTYFSNNNSFFSLHHIERNSAQEIISIKQIEEIYSDENPRHNYIYRYSDGSYSGTLTSDYQSIFQTSRIMRQNTSGTNWKGDAVYYFEVPVNRGEYALGSVAGGTGCYLMYLDIQTNGGTDTPVEVDTFGSVEYRSSPDTIDNSICLITYVQPQNSSLTVETHFEGTTYYVNFTCNSEIRVKVTLLDTDFDIYVNNADHITEIKITELII